MHQKVKINKINIKEMLAVSSGLDDMITYCDVLEALAIFQLYEKTNKKNLIFSFRHQIQKQ